jgi:pyochelin biosynthesis protein PchC
VPAPDPTAPHPWLRCPAPRAGGTRVVAVPHGGAGAGAFAAWPDLLGDDVEVVAVQFPAREDRLADPPPADLQEAAGVVAAAVAALPARPLVLFGHSMGATVAYEVARHLVAQGGPVPDHLVVSSRPAPVDEAGGDVHRRDDEGILAEVARLGGDAPGELGAALGDPGLRALVAACVRDDHRLVETYRHVPGPPLPCPVTVLLGDDDPDVDVVAASRWREVTTASLDVRVLPGGHFHVVDDRARAVAAVGEVVAAVSRSASTPAPRG